MKKQKILDVKLFLAVGLAVTAFLVCITVFVGMYNGLRNEPIFLRLASQEKKILTKKQTVNKVNFIAVGDIMLSRNVARHQEKAWSTQWIWEHIRDFLAQGDFVFGNLEGPTNGTNKYSYDKVLTFNALPELIKTLPSVGFTIVNLANNHILDQWEKGIEETQKLLNEIWVSITGANRDARKIWEPAIVEKNGVKIAFIGASYAAYNDNGSGKSPLVARMQDTERLIGAIRQAREQADFIVVTMHGGQEYTLTPTNLQTDFARTAIDNGADIVIGAHPHWIQATERYKNKYIFYSLGNFVFDQEFSEETKSWLALQIFLEKTEWVTSLTRILLKPIIIENYGQPRLASDEEAAKILGRIKETPILY